MAVQWDDLRDEIVDLYIVQDKPLKEVMEQMSTSHNFRRSERSYRSMLSSCDALKNPARLHDSGYYSNRASAAATPSSRPVSTDDLSHGSTPLVIPPASQDIVPHTSPDTAGWNSQESDGSNNSMKNHAVIEKDQTPTHECNTNTRDYDSLQSPHVFGLLTSHMDTAQAGLENYSTHSPHDMPSPLANFPALSIVPVSVFHAPISRCLRARSQHHQIPINSEGCSLCGASKAHYLANVANTIPKQALFEKLHSDISDINTFDTRRNTPLHFLASLGPMPGRIQIFQKAGADLLSKNTNGDTFLHVLDPSKLEGEDLLGLLEWCVAKGLDLKQRNSDGKTVFHCLIDRKPPSHEWIYVLNTLQSTSTPAAARESPQSPIAGYLLARDNQGRNILDIIQAKGDTSYLEAVRHFFPISELRHSAGPTVASSLLPGSNRCHQSHRLLTTDKLQENDQILWSTLSLAAADPLATNPGDGMNALSCLAYIVRLCPEYETDLRPRLAREDYLRKHLKNGVDPNGYDRFGTPPLHHFLSTFRHNESDEKTADLISLLVFYGADVNMRNSKGQSALHVACELGRISCVQKLIIFKADVRAIDYRSEGIIDFARRWMMNSNPPLASRIQKCIDLISYAPKIHCGENHI